MNAIVIDRNISLNISKNLVGSEKIDTINARELHKTVKSGREFSTWIKSRISKYGFEEGVDFDKIVKPHNNATDYILTLDTAKEIAMVENNEEGRKIRRYLIEIEKQYRNENPPQIDLNDPKACLGEAISLAIKAGIRYNEKESAFKTFAHKTMDQIGEYKEEIEKLKSKNDQYKALHTGVARLGAYELNITIEEMAKMLGISRPALFKELRYRGVLTMKNIPTKRFLVDNLLVVAKMSYQRGEKIVNNYKQTLITPEGVKYLTSIFA